MISATRTAGFTTLVLAQLFKCFNARSETTSASRHLFVNPWLWGAVALGVVLQIAVVHVGFLNAAFGAEPLTIDQWLMCTAMASLVLWISELRKLLGHVLTRTDRRTRAGHPSRAESPIRAV